MIQAITEIDPDQAIPFISYIRQHSSTLREDTAQYDRYVHHPAITLQMRQYPNFIQMQQTTWTQEPFEKRFGWIRCETLPGSVRENTL